MDSFSRQADVVDKTKRRLLKWGNSFTIHPIALVVIAMTFSFASGNYGQVKGLKSNVTLLNEATLRYRRLSGEPIVLSFYRPTKHMSSSLADDPSVLPDNKQKRHESTIDESLYTSVTKNTNPDGKENIFRDDSVGGVNHVQGISTSEERAIEYYDKTSSPGPESKTLGESRVGSSPSSHGSSYDDPITPVDDDIFTDSPFDEDEALDGGNGRRKKPYKPRLDIVTQLLRTVETQALQGANCTPGTDLNLGDRVVNRFAQERFQDAAIVAVNSANWLTRMWKYSPSVIGQSEYLLHTSILYMLEMNEDIFAAGNCYDARQYKEYFLFCPYAYRLPEGPILAKDLALGYNYLSNTSEFFFIARKRAEQVIKSGKSFRTSYHMYQFNSTHHTDKETDLILTVSYEDGVWSKPYYDCGGADIWMITYTVPFFGFQDGRYIFKGTSGIDIDLRRVDINQCPSSIEDDGTFNIFGGTDKCKTLTTECHPVSGLGFRRGSYKCMCKIGFYFPDTTATHRFFNGTDLEEEYAKILEGQESIYELEEAFQCLPCAPGCESCADGSPCIVTLNWVLRTILLILQCIIICCLPIVVLFTYKYSDIKVVRAASPVLLRIIILGAFFIYSTSIVLYPTPNIVTCTMRIWLREIGFALAYGALMLKTWRISVIFRVRSAKAVKITDMDLIKRLGIIVGAFVLFLLIRTLVSPPIVIVGRTAEELKAFLCQSDWWDHSFTILEFLFLLWGIRLCIMVRKAPSEFNESRFISMAIYNEFLLSIFLNVSMFFLQHPANPDLLFIIFFCHSQLTITILLCLIFASKFYLVMKGHGKNDETSLTSKNGPGKFVAAKIRAAHTSLSQQSQGPNTAMAATDGGKLTEKDVQLELDRIFQTLQVLKECNNPSSNNSHLALKIAVIHDAFKQAGTVAAAAAAATTTTAAPTQCNLSLLNDIIITDEKNSDLDDVFPEKKENPESTNIGTERKQSGEQIDSSELMSTSALMLAGAAVSHATATLLQTPCQNQMDQVWSPKSHDSPVIVHAIDRGSQRVSFDLTDDNKPPYKWDSHETKPSCSESNNVFVNGEDEIFVTGKEVALIERKGSGSLSGTSSCRSSRCCCSSYACSFCSPRGSFACDDDEYTNNDESNSKVDSCKNGSNCESCTVDTYRLRYLTPVSKQNAEIRKESKLIQTDAPQPLIQAIINDCQPSNAETLNHVQQKNSYETSPNSDSTGSGRDSICCGHVDEAVLDQSNLTNHHNEGSQTTTESVSKDTKDPQTRDMVNNKHDTRSGHARTHKIIINLDDKDRFTEEIIV